MRFWADYKKELDSLTDLGGYQNFSKQRQTQTIAHIGEKLRYCLGSNFYRILLKGTDKKWPLYGVLEWKVQEAAGSCNKKLPSSS